MSSRISSRGKSSSPACEFANLKYMGPTDTSSGGGREKADDGAMRRKKNMSDDHSRVKACRNAMKAKKPVGIIAGACSGTCVTRIPTVYRQRGDQAQLTATTYL